MSSVTKTRRVTIKDVAIRAEVSLGTVSRIINGNQTVAPELRDHVQSVIRELGYLPNAIARTMRTNRTEVIGIIVTDIRQSVAAQMIAAAAETVRRFGFAPVVGDFLNDAGSEEMLLRFMSERNVDGLLVTISTDEDPRLFDRLRSLSIPVVLWERDGAGQFPSIRSDHRLGTRMAARHLAQAGRHKILLVAGHEHTWAGREQIAGMSEGCGAGQELKVVHTGRFQDEDFRATMEGSAPYDAVVANIHDIPRVLKALDHLGFDIPADVAVISIGDDVFLDVCRPGVTAIRTRPDLVGSRAARRLMTILGAANPSAADESLIEPELVIRGSS